MGDISAKEYNEKYRWDCDGAYCFVKGLEHAMQKSGAYEEAMHQLRCMGWPECQETLLTAIEVYREVVKSKIPGHFHYEFRHVVHCKNCAMHRDWDGNTTGEVICKRFNTFREPDFYCAYGERGN
jgi:hypothetical protein